MDEIFEAATRAAMLVRNTSTNPNSSRNGDPYLENNEKKGKRRSSAASGGFKDEHDGGCKCVIC